jgi:hypothetical protein
VQPENGLRKVWTSGQRSTGNHQKIPDAFGHGILSFRHPHSGTQNPVPEHSTILIASEIQAYNSDRHSGQFQKQIHEKLSSPSLGFNFLF